jgi:hypothetical protein
MNTNQLSLHHFPCRPTNSPEDITFTGIGDHRNRRGPPVAHRDQQVNGAAPLSPNESSAIGRQPSAISHQPQCRMSPPMSRESTLHPQSGKIAISARVSPSPSHPTQSAPHASVEAVVRFPRRAPTPAPSWPPSHQATLPLYQHLRPQAPSLKDSSHAPTSASWFRSHFAWASR